MHAYFCLVLGMRQNKSKHCTEPFFHLSECIILFTVPQSPWAACPEFDHKNREHFKRTVYQVMMELDLLSPNLPNPSGYTEHSQQS